MNERIRELLIEAGFVAPELAGRAHKLVDLIVKECLEIITDYPVGDCSPAVQSIYNDIENRFRAIKLTKGQ